MNKLKQTVCCRCQQGLTLVELMVAIVMGLVLLAGVATVFVANKQTYRVQDALARLQENGRFAMSFLVRDIRRAGYFGCATQRGVPVTNTLNNPSEFLWSLGDAVNGYDADDSGWKPSLPGGIMASGYSLNPAPVPGSDILVVRVAGGCGDRVTAHVQPSADLKLTAKACIADGDIVMVTDCTAAAVFQVTNVTTGSDKKSNVVHNAGTAKYPPGNATKDLGKKYTGGEIIQVSTIMYYVGDTGRGVNALYRVMNGRTPEELVEGVENMQLRFGWGTNSALSVESYDPATESTVWENVRGVEIHLLMQSADASALQIPQSYRFVNNVGGLADPVTASDRRLRQTFSSTAAIRNRVP